MTETNDFATILQQGMTVTAGGGAIVALAFYLRRVFKGLGLEDAQRAAAATAAGASDSILQNLQAEVERLSKRVATLEGQITHLSEKLAAVRLVALECYELALQCDCDKQTRDKLLENLRQIIKDA